MARPSPKPPNRRVMPRSACSKAVKIRGRASGSMPAPLSLTSTAAWPLRRYNRTPTHPSGGVNFTAFLIRFQKTC